jgi:hypothetical protein
MNEYIITSLQDLITQKMPFPSKFTQQSNSSLTLLRSPLFWVLLLCWCGSPIRWDSRRHPGSRSPSVQTPVLQRSMSMEYRTPTSLWSISERQADLQQHKFRSIIFWILKQYSGLAAASGCWWQVSRRFENYLCPRNVSLLAIHPPVATASPEYFVEFSCRENFKLYFWNIS